MVRAFWIQGFRVSGFRASGIILKKICFTKEKSFSGLKNHHFESFGSILSFILGWFGWLFRSKIDENIDVVSGGRKSCPRDRKSYYFEGLWEHFGLNFKMILVTLSVQNRWKNRCRCRRSKKSPSGPKKSLFWASAPRKISKKQLRFFCICWWKK